jgi:hypothetical protein
LPAPRWLDKHALDLSNRNLQFTNCATPDGPTVSQRYEKDKTTIPDVIWMETVKDDTRIPTPQVLIEPPNENKTVF